MFIDSNLKIKKQQFKKNLKNKKRSIKFIEPKTIYHWIDDNSVNKCFQCGNKFYLLLRRHHCRNCGRIFCFNCSNHFIKLQNYKDPQRVCDKCFIKKKQFNRMKKIIHIFQLLPLTIKDYFTIACINRDWSFFSLQDIFQNFVRFNIN